MVEKKFTALCLYHTSVSTQLYCADGERRGATMYILNSLFAYGGEENIEMCGIHLFRFLL